jgi:hypothetical protein
MREIGMRHFRRRADFGYLALIALATQLLLAFGHVHTPRLPDANLALACRTFFKPAADESCPPLKGPRDDCPICWSINLASSVVVPEPPALVLPASEFESWLPLLRTAHVTTIQTAAFDARGPPLPVAA